MSPNNLLDAPLMVPFTNELDIFISQSVKEKIWNMEYIDLSLLLRQNFNMPNETQNCIAVENGKLIVQSVNKTVKIKRIDNIEMWTDAFLNYAKVLTEKHSLLAGDLFMYMSIIRGALSDATFDRVYTYDQQFRLRVSLNPTRSWAQIDGVLWLRFVAKGASGMPIQNVNINSQQKPCFDFNFKKGCFRFNCIYRHLCIKCNGIHPAVLCSQFGRPAGSFQHNSFRKAAPKFSTMNFQAQPLRFNPRPPLMGNVPQSKH